MENTVIISNLPPVWVQWLGNLGLFLLGAGVMTIALILLKLRGILDDVKAMTDETKKTVEDAYRDMMPDVKAITKNVKTISDDAASATHNVTGTVNRVSNVVTSVTNKLESPAIKAVGTISGIMAGARVLSGNKQDVQPKKRGGLGGFLKK